ncbi:hypothetical protein CVD25_07740 [Bacillus canaveralius]|uniref:Uncharacterized protein n=1 Tax=Bacillus canaveralius TaxID=1403243 RepID=A0A2N5GS31_9BACI|nr:hypothetical protein CU635_01895 [Bacillus canaveralius]PLR98602.1 hypothetical protein CVD25_07740 [Bacillus canaveralius]
MQNKYGYIHKMNIPVIKKDFEKMTAISEVKGFSDSTRPALQNFLNTWTAETEENIYSVKRK